MVYIEKTGKLSVFYTDYMHGIWSKNFCLQDSFFKIWIWLKYLLYILCKFFWRAIFVFFSTPLKDANLIQKKYNILWNVHRQDFYEQQKVENAILCILYLFSVTTWWTKSWSQWRWFDLSGGKICCRHLECSIYCQTMNSMRKLLRRIWKYLRER